MFAKFVDWTDIGMFERRSRTGFAFESPERRGILGGILRQELQGNLPAQLKVLRPINESHAAAAKTVQNSVMRDDLADQREGHGIQTAVDCSLHAVAGAFLTGK